MTLLNFCLIFSICLILFSFPPKANRDFVLRQVCEAVNTISDIARGQGNASTQTQQSYGPGELAAALNDLDV